MRTFIQRWKGTSLLLWRGGFGLFIQQIKIIFIGSNQNHPSNQNHLHQSTSAVWLPQQYYLSHNILWPCLSQKHTFTHHVLCVHVDRQFNIWAMNEVHMFHTAVMVLVMVAEGWKNALKMNKPGVHFAKYTLEIKVWKLLVIAFRKYITSRGLRALCNGPETLTQWKCGSVTDDNVGEDGIWRWYLISDIWYLFADKTCCLIWPPDEDKCNPPSPLPQAGLAGIFIVFVGRIGFGWSESDYHRVLIQSWKWE